MKSIILHNLFAGPGVKDVSSDSNLWHVRNYEAVSEKVYVLLLAFKIKNKKVIRKGKTIIIAVGTSSTIVNIFLSPFKLVKFVLRLKPKLTITYEQVFLWWTLIFVKLFTKTINILIPIALPHKIYEITGKSLSLKLPIWFEKILRNWSFRSVTKIVTTKNLGDYKKWLLNDKIAKNKTLIFNKLPEEVPSVNFVSNINKCREPISLNSKTYNLITIGRLQSEKLIDHTILAVTQLIKRDNRYRLTIIGDGDEKDKLMELVRKNQVCEYVKFEGYKNTLEIIEYCKSMHVFVSPYTGGALREAALLRLPIVAYNTDWIKNELLPNEEYAAAEFLNYQQMADKIEQVILDSDYAKKIVNNMFNKAKELWTPDGLDKEFERFFPAE